MSERSTSELHLAPCGMVHIKEPLLLIGKSSLSPYVTAAGFLSHYQNGP